jgi:hypothetical protein
MSLFLVSQNRQLLFRAPRTPRTRDSFLHLFRGMEKLRVPVPDVTRCAATGRCVKEWRTC